MNNQRALESAVYVQGDFELSPKWSLSAGLRYSYFLRLGKDEIYEYDYSRYKVVSRDHGYSKLRKWRCRKEISDSNHGCLPDI